MLRAHGDLERIGVSAARLVNATHLVWGTGGSMVPAGEFEGYVERGMDVWRRLSLGDAV
jgi:D-serine dehydratase